MTACRRPPRIALGAPKSAAAVTVSRVSHTTSTAATTGGAVVRSAQRWLSTSALWRRMPLQVVLPAFPNSPLGPEVKEGLAANNKLEDPLQLELLLDSLPRAPLFMSVQTLYHNLKTSEYALLRRHPSSSSGAAASPKDAAEEPFGSHPRCESCRCRQHVAYTKVKVLHWLMQLAGVSGLGPHEARKGWWPPPPPYGVFLSFDMLHVTVASSAAEAGKAFVGAYPPLSPTELVKLNNDLRSMTLTGADSTVAGCSAPFRWADLCLPSSFNDVCDDPSGAGLSYSQGYWEEPGRSKALRQRSRLVATSQRRCLSSSSSTSSSPPCLVECFMPFWGEDFVPPVPPLSSSLPPSSSVAASEADGRRSSSGSASFLPQHLEALVPTHFVPVETLLARLPPGYTVEHVRCVFKDTKALEVVELGEGGEGGCYVRFHGGCNGEGFDPDEQRRVARSPQEHDDEVRETYEPDPFLLYAFLPRFRRPFQWTSLYELIEQAPASLKKALLPLREYSTLLYFAQQQQRVQFTPQRGGAVSLCFPPVRSLQPETTPLPRELLTLRRLLHRRGFVYVTDLEDEEGQETERLSDGTKLRIIAHFGTLRRFLFQHQRVFRLDIIAARGGDAAVPAEAPPDTLSVSAGVGVRRGSGFASSPPCGKLSSDRLDAEGFPLWLASKGLAVALAEEDDSRRRAGVPPEELLERALSKRHRHRANKIRRRIAVLSNPDSPYVDRATLLDAILRYLPPTGHVAVRNLLSALPNTMREFLPTDPVRLFRNAPEKVQLFEYRQRNHLRVMRPGLPLPDGRLRSHFREEELLYMIAAELSPGRSRSSLDLNGRLSHGARETVRREHHHLIDLLERHPKYFLVVYQSAQRLRHTAWVQCIHQPPSPATLHDEDWDAAKQSLTAEEEAAVNAADKAAIMDRGSDNPSAAA